MNLKRKFMLDRMKENENMKDFTDRITALANKIILFGEPITDQRIVEQILVSLLKKFESKISSLEELKDIAAIKLSDLINSLEALETMRAFRQNGVTEVAFMEKQKHVQSSGSMVLANGDGRQKNHVESSSAAEKKGKILVCSHCGKSNHREKSCWRRPDAHCKICKQKGHIARI